jgi:ribosomal protein S18 acetylase RimI-like enzyme
VRRLRHPAVRTDASLGSEPTGWTSDPAKRHDRGPVKSRRESGLPSLLFEVCRPSDVPEMCRVLAETFARNDPPAVAVGLTAAEFEAFVRLVSASEITRALTIVARHAASGRLAGAMLAEDAASPPPERMTELSPKFDPIFDLFGLLETQLAEPPADTPGDVLHLFLLGVDDRFAGRGVGQRLVREALDNGIAKGYRTAVAEATNLGSQHIFSKLGFTTRAQTSYAAYRRDGVPVFASIADQGGPMSMIRDLESAEHATEERQAGKPAKRARGYRGR